MLRSKDSVLLLTRISLSVKKSGHSDPLMLLPIRNDYLVKIFNCKSNS